MDDSTKRMGMRLIILDILSRENLHGYGISERIEEKYGIGKPSSGIIYPALSSLKKRGLIELCEEGKRDKKVYAITEKGRKYLEDHTEEVESIKRTLYNLGEFNKMGGRKLMHSIHFLIKHIHLLNDKEKKELKKTIRLCITEIERFGGGKAE